MPRPLNDQVVVITGASSGIGRETALRFAEHGATVVLAARNEPALREAAEECHRRGGRAVADIVDVADWRQVERLANQTVERFGRIDTWINNAAVSEYATVEQMAIEEIERIIQVDLLGTIYGTKAALVHMRREDQGTILCVGSILGVRAVPLQSAYCAAKHGIKGFVESLRMELQHAGSGVQVTLVMPTSTNTPFFAHARSKIGAKPRPIPPVYEPGVVADAIVFAAEHPRRDIVIGSAGKLFEVLQRISPSLVDWYMTQGGRMFRQQMADAPDNGRDGLFEPVLGPGSSTGDWNGRTRSLSLYTRLFERHPNLRRLAAGAAVLGVAALLRGAARPIGDGHARSRAHVSHHAGRLMQSLRSAVH